MKKSGRDVSLKKLPYFLCGSATHHMTWLTSGLALKARVPTHSASFCRRSRIYYILSQEFKSLTWWLLQGCWVQLLYLLPWHLLWKHSQEKDFQEAENKRPAIKLAKPPPRWLQPETLAWGTNNHEFPWEFPLQGINWAVNPNLWYSWWADTQSWLYSLRSVLLVCSGKENSQSKVKQSVHIGCPITELSTWAPHSLLVFPLELSEHT